MKRRFLLLAIATLAVLFAAAALFQLFQPYVRARILLSRISKLQVGRTSFEEAQRVGKELGSQGNEPCSPEDCYWTFEVDNFRLPAVWRKDGERFVAGYRIQNSVLSEQRFMFQIGTGFNALTAEFWERETWPHFPSQFIVGTQTAPTHPHFRSYVKLTPATAADVRERYLKFELNCLWKYHGCADAKELLPTVDWN